MKEVIIDGVVYVPKEAVKEDNSTPSFKVGDWVIGPESIWSGPHRISDNNDTYLDPNLDPYDCRLATPEEIETYLIAEAERRGFKRGVKYHSVKTMGEADYWEDVNTVPPYLEWRYGLGGDSLDCGDGLGLLYYEGRWAEIIKEPRPLPKTVEELNDLFKEALERFRNGDEDDLDKSFDKFMEEFR